MAEVIDSLVKKLVLLEEIDDGNPVHKNWEQLVMELLDFQQCLDAQKLTIQKESDPQRRITEAMKVATQTKDLMENYLNKAHQKRRLPAFTVYARSNDLIDRRKLDENLAWLGKRVRQVNDWASSSLAQQDIGNFDAIGMVNYAILALKIAQPHSSEGCSGGVTTKEDGPAKSIVEDLEQLLPFMEKMKKAEGSSKWVNVKSFAWLWKKETRMLAEAILTHFSHSEGIRPTEEEMKPINILAQDIVQRLQVSLQLKEAPFTNGLNAQKRELVRELISSEANCNRVFIVGMEGVGKTALANLLYHNKRVTKHFHARAWVTLSKQYDYNADCARSGLRQDIESQLSKKKLIPGEEEESAAESRSRRYLIVLDNVWSTTVWNSLKFEVEGIPIPNGSTAKILITTRHVELADEVSYVHKMGLLSESESWQLFTRILKSPRLSPELENLGRKIVRRCGGLPPEIIEMGRRLFRVTNTNEWSSVLESQEGGPWYHILNRMKEDLGPLRGCLFYFGLFPAEAEIPARRLIALWVAKKGLIPRNDEQLPEEVAESYLRRFIDLGVVQVTKRNINGKVKTCRLLEPVWEFWVSEARKNNFFQIAHISPKFSREYLMHRVDDKDESHEHSHGNDTNSFSRQRLVSLLSFHTRGGSRARKEVEKFVSRCISYQCFRLLLFLDLENVFRPQLPKALRKLTSLRYLGLRRTYLVELPSFIDKLLNLQTLDLKHTYIGTLPRSIWMMRQLRHLYLSEAYRSRFVRPPCWHRCCGRSLTQLQTLWGAFIDEKSPVIGGLNTLPNIRKLGLASRFMSPSQQESLSSKLDAVAGWIANLKNLESLRLKSYDENGEPSDLHIEPFPCESKLSSIYLLGRLNHSRYSLDVLKQLFPATLTEITLSASKLPIDPMRMLGRLEKLQILQLFHESYEAEEMFCSKEGFPRLQVLKLWKLEKLEKWHVEKGALPSLTDLEIRSCTSLAKLPEELPPELQVLKLCNLEKLEQLYVNKGALPRLTELEIRSCTSLVKLPEELPPELQVLKLCNLEKLEQWHVNKGTLPRLTYLEIRCCTLWTMLPKGLKRVITLKELKLSSMPEEFMNKIKDEESQAWYKIKPREHPEENQIEDMVLLRKVLQRW